MKTPESNPSRLPPGPPAWAEEFGEDKYGLFASFQLESVPFVFRWIPPGSFLMGSPGSEIGRYGDERPQHEVTITSGFWLGETPVTQLQWSVACHLEVVYGSRDRDDSMPEGFSAYPSHFRDPKWNAMPGRVAIGSGIVKMPLDDDRAMHPVESVSYFDCKRFLAVLARVWSMCFLPKSTNIIQRSTPRLFLATEAQWEYACRAGTQGAFGDGSPCTDPAGKDAALDRLGWFDKNSARTTHPVKGKACNGWGLYDMHGNVWEWCQDGKREYQIGSEVDPVGLQEKGVWRVVRGGSWSSTAGGCRAAFRFGFGPGDRGGSLGFRLAAGQELGVAEPPGAERPRRKSEGGSRKSEV